MRLIDADALEYSLGSSDRDILFMDMLSEAPTIDAVEVKHGEWIKHFDGNEWCWFCSACKEQWYEEDLYMGGCDFPNYCPNCGAKMEVEHDRVP